ncbi:MAG: hypothetical protein ACE5E5_07985 [Phycisphaerae bacterium]
MRSPTHACSSPGTRGTDSEGTEEKEAVVLSQRNILWAGAAFSLGLLIAFAIMREKLEPLTTVNLSQAKARWKASGVGPYRMTYLMNGMRYEVVGDHGVVMKLTANGQPARSSEFRLYGVDGLFDILAMDLENVANPSGPFAGGGHRMFLRVRFNERYGYIEKYLRSSGGVGTGASIDLMDFQVLSGM